MTNSLINKLYHSLLNGHLYHLHEGELLEQKLGLNPISYACLEGGQTCLLPIPCHDISYLEVHLDLLNMHLTMEILNGTYMELEEMQLDRKELALRCDSWSCCNNKDAIVIFKHIRMALNSQLPLWQWSQEVASKGAYLSWQ